MIATVRKIGGYLAIVIPKSIALEMELVEGGSLELKVEGDSFILRKKGRRARRSMGALVGKINTAAYRQNAAQLL